MQIIQDFPPNINELNQAFDLSNYKPVFTYGDIMYNPFGSHIPDDLMAHENVHENQQAAYGVEKWWEDYIADKSFRFSQEVEAYGVQYNYICQKVKDRNRQFDVLHNLAVALASKMYGNCCTYSEAVRAIRNHSGVDVERYDRVRQ